MYAFAYVMLVRQVYVYVCYICAFVLCYVIMCQVCMYVTCMLLFYGMLCYNVSSLYVRVKYMLLFTKLFVNDIKYVHKN